MTIKLFNSGTNNGSREHRVFLKLRRTPHTHQVTPHTTEPNTGNTTGNSTPPTVVADPTPPTTQTTTTTTTISETAIMWMRAKTIVFQATGLKPNTKYYPFFDSVYVGMYCSIVDEQLESEIVTNDVGDVTGNFYMPGGTFTTGSHKFQLVDHVDSDNNPSFADPLYGAAEAMYEAHGTLKTLQSQVTPEAPVTNVPDTAPPNVVNPEPPDPTTPPVTPTPPKKKCEEWFFDYTIHTEENLRYFTVTSSDPTPPSNPSHRTGGGPFEQGFEDPTITYIDTTVNRFGQYNHRYSFMELSTSSVRRQYWRGPVGDPAVDLPSLSTFRPSGLAGNQTVRITRQWTYNPLAAYNRWPMRCPKVGAFYTPPPPTTYTDPLAQSIYIDGNAFPNGAYVTSIEVFFRTVDQSTPVSLELRNTINGYPGPSIMPNGQVVLSGTSASQSDDATVATVFRFDTPVFVQPHTEYCFVLKSASLGYNVWSSRVGDTDVTTGRVIDTNPYGGTLFKSENDSTWIPDSYEDIKFNVNVAVFDTTAVNKMVFRPQAFTVSGVNHYYATKQSLPLSHISTTYNSRLIKAYIPMHGLKSGDYMYSEVLITDNPIAYNGLHYLQLTGEFVVTRVDDDNLTFTAKNGTTVGLPTDYVANRTGAVPIKDGLTVLDYAQPIMPVAAVNYAAAPITNPDNFSPSTVPSTSSALTAPLPPVFVQSPTFTVYTNLVINEAMIDYLGTELPQTNITEKVKVAVGFPEIAGGDPVYTSRNFVEVEKDGQFYMFDEPRALATPRNESENAATLGGESSLIVNIDFQSSDKNISPIIDMNGISLVARTYKIDNQNDEIDILLAARDAGTATIDDFNDPQQNSEIVAGKGNAAAKYKSTVVQLSDYFKTIDIYVIGNCPAPAAFDCYIRTSSDESTHRDRPWKWVPVEGDFNVPFDPSSDKYVMNEWNFEHTADESFNVFDIKLVMRTTNPSAVPKIYSIRTITDIAY